MDLDTSISSDCSLQIITEKDPEGLEVIRHSTAHLLAYAAKSLYPDMQVTIGPVIENGFYYDFAYSRPLTPEDLVKIENKMIALSKKNEKAKSKENSDFKPTFLVGFPRSGTTLLDTILRSNSKVNVVEERPIIHTAKSFLKLKGPVGELNQCCSYQELILQIISFQLRLMHDHRCVLVYLIF